MSDAYRHAQGLIKPFRASGGPPVSGAVNISDTAWSPSFGSRPSQPELPAPVAAAVERELKSREDRARKLSNHREVWRVALEKIERDQNWQKELEFWVEESQAAQIGALQTSLGLLVGAAGPVANGIDTHRDNAVTLWNSAQKSRTRLEEVRLLIRGSKLPADETAALSKAVNGLQQEYDGLTKAMKSEAALAERFKKLDTLGDGLLNAVKWIELLKDLKEKHNLMLAAKTLADFAVNTLIDAGFVKAQEKLIAAGKVGAANTARLASFAIDYGYNSMRFYLAWAHVHDILGQIEDTKAVTASLGRKVTEATDQLKALRDEVKQLQGAKQNKAEAEKVLADLRQKDMHEAWFAGEWFSQQSGISAPGEPIVPK